MSAEYIVQEVEETLSPRNNPHLFGHKKAEATLRAAWESEHLHHAWLISGPEGIGKATLAHRFARFLLSQEAKVGETAATQTCLQATRKAHLPKNRGAQLYTDSESRLFGRVAAGGHAGLLTVTRSIDPKTKKLRGEIVVDDVRGIGRFLHMTAAEGGTRVVVIDPGDDMNRNAANALLKSLEEPPAKTVILVVSHTPGRLLPTIRSRCRGLRLAPLGEADFTRVVAQLQPDMEPAVMAELFRLSGGSPGKARRLAKEGASSFITRFWRCLPPCPRMEKAVQDTVGELITPPSTPWPTGWQERRGRPPIARWWTS
jgi:DNA polymerase-3 subunit delta'